MSDTEPLSPLEIDRVIDETNSRTYMLEKVLVFFFDDRFELYEGATFSCENPVPVYGSDSKHIGTAIVYRDGKKLMADFFLDFNTAERLDIESKSTPLYPHILGLAAMDTSEKEWRVGHLHLIGLSIERNAPADNRIESL